MELLEALEILEGKIKKGKKFYIQECGICENVAVISKKYFHQQIKDLVVNWKYYSGDAVYPIGGILVYNNHKSNETLWKDEQLKLRLDLIKFLKRELGALK